MHKGIIMSVAKAIRHSYVRMKTPADWQALRLKVQEATVSEQERLALLEDCENGLWRAIAKDRTPLEWVEALLQIEDLQVRAKVASILWWDHCTHMPELWPLVLSYNRFQNDDSEAIYGALRSIGYPHKRAKRRSVMPKTNYDITAPPRMAQAASLERRVCLPVGGEEEVV